MTAFLLLALGLSSAGASSAELAVRDFIGTMVAETTTAPSGDQDGLIPRRLVWPGVAVIVVLAVIATAALTGPIIRANSDDEDPQNGAESSD